MKCASTLRSYKCTTHLLHLGEVCVTALVSIESVQTYAAMPRAFLPLQRKLRYKAVKNVI